MSIVVDHAFGRSLEADEPAETRLADRDKQGLEGLASVRQIAQALLDQIPPRQGAKLHPQIIAGHPR